MRQPDGFIEVIEVGEIFFDIRLNSAGSFRAEWAVFEASILPAE